MGGLKWDFLGVFLLLHLGGLDDLRSVSEEFIFN